jgi:DNA-binding NtrC family response regulator
MHDGTILVVDDKPENIRLLFEALQEGGYRTLAAVNGERAVEQAELAGPDLILLDVMMPGIDGFETCRRLKRREATRGIPVIFVTALGETVDKLRGFEASGVDYLTKPLQHEEVLARVRAHLGRERLWREVSVYSRLLLDMGTAETLEQAWSALPPLLEAQPRLAGLALWERDTERGALVLRGQLGFAGPGPDVWRRGDGTYAQVPLSDTWLGEVVESGEQHFAPSSDTWQPYPVWAKAAELRGYIASPLLCRGDVYGVVLAVYTGMGPERFAEHRHWQAILGRSLGNAVFQTRSLRSIRELGEQLRRENEGLRAEMAAGESPEGMVGESPAFRRVLDQAARVADTEAPVLIQGESGTGKEVLAEWIHRRSPRAAAPLIRVNCAAVPSELFESEFFGHVKGAFTGAVQDRVGRFELARGGTLFLDEVGEIPLSLQGKLLRVLQEGTFERVGEGTTRETDVRILAATNRDLRTEVAEGRFREDLYYRLGVFPLTLPPLRERMEDLPGLARMFARQVSRKLGLACTQIPEEVLEPLKTYAWPGNIRELRNQLERSLIYHRGIPDRFTPPSDATSTRGLDPGPSGILTEEQMRDVQRENMKRALDRTDWRVDGPGGAAEILGLRPTTLRSRMKALGLRRG